MRRAFSLAKTSASIRSLRFSAVPDEPGPIGEESQAAGRAPIHVTNSDNGLTGGANVNLPVNGDVGAGGITDIIGRLAGDIARCAVQKESGNHELLVDGP